MIFFFLTFSSILFSPPVLLLGICACCYRHPRGRGGDQMLHARQGSELTDLQQAHSERSARWLQRTRCILARLRQCQGLQLNQMLLTVGEAEFKEWGGGYGLAGTWLRGHAAAPATTEAVRVQVASHRWLLAGLWWILGFAEGFLGRCTANARGLCVLIALDNFGASSWRLEAWGVGSQCVYTWRSLLGGLGVHCSQHQAGVNFQVADVIFLNPACS